MGILYALLLLHLCVGSQTSQSWRNQRLPVRIAVLSWRTRSSSVRPAKTTFRSASPPYVYCVRVRFDPTSLFTGGEPSSILGGPKVEAPRTRRHRRRVGYYSPFTIWCYGVKLERGMPVPSQLWCLGASGERRNKFGAS